MTRLDHIAVCVRDLEAALTAWRDALGLEVLGVEDLPDRGVRVAMLQVGDTRIELVQPLNDTSEVSAFLAKRGEGLHHLALAVDDVAEARSNACRWGAKPVPGAGGTGAGGSRVAFLHPRTMNGVLVELVEGDGGHPGT